MYNHEPIGYTCPFCLIVEGVENEHLYTKQDYVVYRYEYIIASDCWENNKGHKIYFLMNI